MKMHRIILTAIACALFVPLAAHAQVAVRIIDRGLLGVFTESSSSDGHQRQRILEVVPGSPADRAGVRKGDIVVAINGQTATDQVMRAGMEPGETVVMRILRDGVERDYTMVVAERPRNMQMYMRPVLSDSVLREIAVIMENVRTEVDTLVFQRLQVPRADGEGNITITFGGDSIQVLRFAAGDSTRVFRFGEGTRFVPHGAGGRILHFGEGDSIRTLWSFGGDSARVVERFQAFPEELRSRFMRTPGAADSLHATFIEAFAGRAMPFPLDSLHPMPRPGEIFASGFTVGMRAVAGAELSELNPDLAEYFGVTGGVLVLNAREGTPAARAGIRAGDVIVQVNQTPVGSIAEVRRAVDTRNAAPVQIRVLRRGAPVDVTISRD